MRSTMSRYVGWSEEASRRVHNGAVVGDLQLPNNDSVALTQTLRSFTPINQGPANISMLNNSVRTRSRGLDSDMLYDPPDQPLSGSPALKKRRQAIKKLARPKKTSSSVLSHPWPRAVEKEASQLGTPPDSKKRFSKRSSTQLELFSSASITKPIVGPIKVITTEDVLKSKNVSLGQTTMQKLASYRFQSAGHYLTDIEASRIADSTEGVEKPEKTPEPCHETTSYGEEAPNHVLHDHCLTSLNKSELYRVLDDHDLASHNEDELYREFDDLGPTDHNEDDPHQVFDEATVLNHDDDMIIVEAEEASTKHGGTPPDVWSDTEDDFPIDDELGAEMAQLLMPDKNHESPSANLLLNAVRNENLQSRGPARVHFQVSSPGSHTIVGDNNTATDIRCDSVSSMDSFYYLGTAPRQLDKAIDWPSIHEEGLGRASTGEENHSGAVPSAENITQVRLLAESSDYSPLKPFARPQFPSKVLYRSPITGVSSRIILRTCFRIGEALREGALCEGLKQDAIIELFARVRNSSYDTVTPFKLYFEFADLFHDRPPFLRGSLENNKISSLQETESRMLLAVEGPPPMVRCLGRLKRVISGPPGWMLYIINIRPTDWEEVRWTKQIVGAGMAK